MKYIELIRNTWGGVNKEYILLWKQLIMGKFKDDYAGVKVVA